MASVCDDAIVGPTMKEICPSDQPATRRRAGPKDRRWGFSLIELMIVLVIIAILATIAYSAYASQVRKVRRSAVQTYMMTLSAKEQQNYVDTRQYTSTTTNTATDAFLGQDTSVSDYYAVTVATASGPPPTFTITATPITGTSQATDGTLTLTSSGTKTPADKW